MGTGRPVSGSKTLSKHATLLRKKINSTVGLRNRKLPLLGLCQIQYSKYIEIIRAR